MINNPYDNQKVLEDRVSKVEETIKDIQSYIVELNKPKNYNNVQKVKIEEDEANLILDLSYLNEIKDEFEQGINKLAGEKNPDEMVDQLLGKHQKNFFKIRHDASDFIEHFKAWDPKEAETTQPSYESVQLNIKLTASSDSQKITQDHIPSKEELKLKGYIEFLDKSIKILNKHKSNYTIPDEYIDLIGRTDLSTRDRYSKILDKTSEKTDESIKRFEGIKNELKSIYDNLQKGNKINAEEVQGVVQFEEIIPKINKITEVSAKTSSNYEEWLESLSNDLKKVGLIGREKNQLKIVKEKLNNLSEISLETIDFLSEEKDIEKISLEFKQELTIVEILKNYLSNEAVRKGIQEQIKLSQEIDKNIKKILNEKNSSQNYTIVGKLNPESTLAVLIKKTEDDIKELRSKSEQLEKTIKQKVVSKPNIPPPLPQRVLPINDNKDNNVIKSSPTSYSAPILTSYNQPSAVAASTVVNANTNKQLFINDNQSQIRYINDTLKKNPLYNEVSATLSADNMKITVKLGEKEAYVREWVDSEKEKNVKITLKKPHTDTQFLLFMEANKDIAPFYVKDNVLLKTALQLYEAARRVGIEDKNLEFNPSVQKALDADETYKNLKKLSSEQMVDLSKDSKRTLGSAIPEEFNLKKPSSLTRQ